MISAQKFQFDRSFDPDHLGGNGMVPGPGAGNGVRPGKRRTPHFTEDDLAKARAEGMAEGRDQASRDLAESIELRMTSAFEAVGERLSELLCRQDAAHAGAARDAGAVAVAIARRMVPDLYHRNALAEIEHTVARVLSQVLETPELTVRVSGTLSEPLGERLGALANARGLDQRIRIAVDPDLIEGDCLIEWAGGGAERTAAAAWDEIGAIVEKTLGHVPALPAGDTTLADLDETDGMPLPSCLNNVPCEETEAGEHNG